MNKNPLIRATLFAALSGLATLAAAQASADNIGKSTSGGSPIATPVPPGPAGGMASSDAAYGRYWSTLDANGDGRVTREEYMAYHTGRWDRNDTAKRGYYDRDGMRELYIDRELSKTDGQPRGTPLNPTTKK